MFGVVSALILNPECRLYRLYLLQKIAYRCDEFGCARWFHYWDKNSNCANIKQWKKAKN